MAKKKAKAKAAPKLKKGYVLCPDCDGQYKAGMPHTMFCEAHTCSECGTSFGYVLPVYDSRVTPPERRCDDCLLEEDEDSYGERMDEEAESMNADDETDW